MKLRIFTLLLCLAALLALSACGGEEAPVNPNVDPANALISEDGTSPWVIIRSDSKEIATSAMTTLAESIETKTGVKMKLGTDFVKAGTQFVENEYEIIVGPSVREATAAVEADITRNRDFVIARSGKKIVIYATQAIGDAVAYFTENYVVDGNIYIPDGEKVVYNDIYELPDFTIGGTDIKEFQLGYAASEQILSDVANSLANWINEKCGYSLKVGIVNPNTAKNSIIFVRNDDLNTAATGSIKLQNSNIVVTVGALMSAGDAYNQLLDAFTGAASNGKAAIDKLDLSITSNNNRLEIADAAYLASLDKKAEGMKEAVLNTKSEWKVADKRRVFYFSADGDDANNGLTEDMPKKSLSAINSLALLPGDVILFRRGDMFRGSITAKSGITYSAYGEGPKPIINNSLQDYADASLWTKTQHENVWRLNKKLNNVGIMVFNRTWEIGNYNEITGWMEIKGKNGFEDESMLDKDLDFYSNLDTQELFLYCSKGNPGEVYESIEIGYVGNAIAVGGANNVTVDNLHVTLTGSHGVGAGSCTGLTVRNCLFDWLGGSILKGHGGGNVTRYGNAVEVYGGAKQYTVYNNWIYQIYDTGITHQYSSTPDNPSNIHDGVEYYDNLIEYCFWSIEYYNTMVEGTVRKTLNVNVHDNFCRFGGEGWGCPGRETGAPMHALNFSGEECENYVVKDNIFDRCLGILFRYTGDKVEFYENTYIQHYGERLAYIHGRNYPFDGTALDTLNSIGDTSSKLVYIMEPRVTEDAEEAEKAEK